MNITAQLHTAIEAALKAGERILDIYHNEDFDVDFKSDDSPLTKADTASHHIIMSYLEKTGIPVLSEEGKGIVYETRKDWEYLWIVDPIDGTKGFLRSEQYAVALALIEGDRIILGALGCPNLPTSGEMNGNGGPGVLLVAALDQGTRLYPLEDGGDAGNAAGDTRGVSVRVNEEANLSMARFCESVESAHSNQDHAARIAGRDCVSHGYPGWLSTTRWAGGESSACS